MMKKYILAICCMAFVGQAFAQLKTYFIHKKDGTTLALPMGTTRLDFTGKAVVYDDDYTFIERISTDIPNGKKPYAVIKDNTGRCLDYLTVADFDRIGVCYSTEPEVSTVNGNLVEMTMEEYHSNGCNERGIWVDSLDFNTTYYCRSFVTYRGKDYYSSEKSFSIGKPKMEWYQLDIPAPLQEAGIYVHPTAEAWERLYAQDTSFTTSDKFMKIRDEMTRKEWKERYLTVEKAKALAKQCTQSYDCEDGTIYLLDEVGQDFTESFTAPFETSMYGMKGLLTENKNFINNTDPIIDTITCSESLNVPGNTYYKFKRKYPSSNPSVPYLIDRPLLVGQEYEVEIVMAPDTENDTLRLPSKINVRYWNGRISGMESERCHTTRLDYKVEIDPNECVTLKYVISPTEFAENAIEIQSNVAASQSKKYTRDLRIARITVRPVPKE